MNVILIGMPGSGKSTVGVLLAKAMLKSFVDTDLLVQIKQGMTLTEIIGQKGIDGFVNIENEIVKNQMFENTVVATGGSVVYGKEAMEALKQNGRVVYLKVDPDELEKRVQNITTRGIAMPQGYTLKELYSERAPLYEHYADATVDCTNLNIEETVINVVKAIERLNDEDY